MNDGSGRAGKAWAKIIHAAGERPSLREARAQYDKEFEPWADSGVLAARKKKQATAKAAKEEAPAAR